MSSVSRNAKYLSKEIKVFYSLLLLLLLLSMARFLLYLRENMTGNELIRCLPRSHDHLRGERCDNITGKRMVSYWTVPMMMYTAGRNGNCLTIPDFSRECEQYNALNRCVQDSSEQFFACLDHKLWKRQQFKVGQSCNMASTNIPFQNSPTFPW